MESNLWQTLWDGREIIYLLCLSPKPAYTAFKAERFQWNALVLSYMHKSILLLTTVYWWVTRHSIQCQKRTYNTLLCFKWDRTFQQNNLKFDESDPILGSNNGELSCIFALITGDNVEFNLHANHGLRELVSDWLLGSTAPVLWMNVDWVELVL